jgi:hypothetical protein
VELRFLLVRSPRELGNVVGYIDTGFRIERRQPHCGGAEYLSTTA